MGVVSADCSITVSLEEEEACSKGSEPSATVMMCPLRRCSNKYQDTASGLLARQQAVCWRCADGFLDPNEEVSQETDFWGGILWP